ncbi:hypothetical protein [Serratia plymuthica]|uniref:hypothetical protein n=1 Tax=Serratia plymuthica TaxID=82996 RepID=UPI0018D81876|nr:hypothetical protein [Serratia plymuthica]QPS58545.1 hypothetical protein I6G53_18735 [Serratia plymuthica]
MKRGKPVYQDKVTGFLPPHVRKLALILCACFTVIGALSYLFMVKRPTVDSAA